MLLSVHINIFKICKNFVKICVLIDEANTRHMLHIFLDNSPPPTKKGLK